MQSLDDITLLRQFIEQRSDDAFAALVNRYINLVYSVAMRQLGQPQDAEEVTQAVFIILAQKAAGLRNAKTISSWLFQTTRLTANNFIRGKIRRQHREEEAYMQSVLEETPTESWQKIGPLLDHAVAALREKDRQAILLRFYEGHNLRDIGAVLGTNEDAAQKRVERALEKLRTYFSKHGIPTTSAALSDTISTHSIQLAPAALAKSVTALAVTKGASASVSTLTLTKGALKIMAWTKTQTAVTAGVILILAAGTVIMVHHSNRHQMIIQPSDSANHPPSQENMNRLNWAKEWALTIILYSNTHQNKLPTKMDDMFSSMSKEGQADEKNWELVSHGKFQDIHNPSQTILLREKEPQPTSDGGYTRTYAFADGHSQIVASPNSDFTGIEQKRGFLVQSP